MKTFLCKNNPASFFTAVFEAIGEKDCRITSDRQIQMTLDCEIIEIEEAENKIGRVVRRLSEYDRNAIHDICIVLRSGDNRKEQATFRYIKKLIERKRPINAAYHLPEVIEFNDLFRKVTGETHRMKGFLRFMENAEGILYAPYTPDNDITDLLMPHFAERFRSEKFVIHDLKRKIAGLYDGQKWITGFAGEANISLSEYELDFAMLWKKYYSSVNIVERPHEKQMRGYMPARYWKFMPEKMPDQD